MERICRHYCSDHKRDQLYTFIGTTKSEGIMSKPKKTMKGGLYGNGTKTRQGVSDRLF